MSENTQKSRCKHFIGIGLVALFALHLVVGAAFARDHRDRDYDGPRGWDNAREFKALDADKREKLGAILNQHFDRMQPLRDQMWAKNLELDALSQNPNATPEMISKLVQEIAGLRAQMLNERDDMRSAMEKEIGTDFGPRFGRGYGGYGCGFGPGYGHRGGHGGWGGHRGGHGDWDDDWDD